MRTAPSGLRYVEGALDAWVGAHDGDGSMAKLSGLIEPEQEVPAIHHRHHEIEQDQLRTLATSLEGLSCFLAIRHAFRLVTLRSQDRLYGFSDVRVVVDHQDSHGPSSPLSVG